MSRRPRWVEVGEHVFAGRYDFYEHNIGLVIGGTQGLLVDTRATEAMAREILDDLRVFGRLEVVGVVDTHGHWDHAFGNHAFRPVPIWGQARCPPFMQISGEIMRAGAIAKESQLATDLAAVVIDPPDRLVDVETTIDVGGRLVMLRHLGKGHTDHDLVIEVPDASALFVGDLFVGDRTPYFADAHPVSWAATAAAVGALGSRAIVTGHGAGSPELVAEMSAGFAELARLTHDVWAGGRDEAGAVGAHPFPNVQSVDRLLSVRRGVLELAGQLS